MTTIDVQKYSEELLERRKKERVQYDKKEYEKSDLYQIDILENKLNQSKRIIKKLLKKYR